MTKVSEVLDGAADLLSKPGAWTQGHEALTKDGEWTRPVNDDACQFCMVGALAKVGGYQGQSAAIQFLRKMLRKKPWIWNDAERRTQAEVVAALRKAATLARTQEKNDG